MIVIWSTFFITKKYGTTAFLLLFVALTLTGGGIGHIPFFLLVWAYATRINSSLNQRKKKIPSKLRNLLSKTWLCATFMSGAFFIIGLEISVFGYVPNVSDPEKIFSVCWSFLFASLFLINYSYIAGFAKDTENKTKNNN
jgi:hypothetical protein